VTDPWVRATVPGQQATGAFMVLQSTDNAQLVGASSSLSKQVEVHEMAMENDVMRMRQVEKIDLPTGKAVELKPGGYHIMLLGLDKQVQEGSSVDLTLQIQNAAGQKEELKINAPVRALNTKANQGHKGAHGH
jgi:copper(I)-binding protein